MLVSAWLKEARGENQEIDKTIIQDDENTVGRSLHAGADTDSFNQPIR
jgi:hypothetical protein